MAVGALADQLEKPFINYMEAFLPILIQGLSNNAEYQVWQDHDDDDDDNSNHDFCIFFAACCFLLQWLWWGYVVSVIAVISTSCGCYI